MQAKREVAPAVKLIQKMIKEVGAKEKEEKEEKNMTEDEKAKKAAMENHIKLAEDWLKQNVNKILFDKTYYTKGERKAAVKVIKEKLDLYLFEQDVERDARKTILNKTIDKAIDAEITRELIENKRRVDGRGLNELRPIGAEVYVLPRNHGI